jgi:hypothetical protein
MDFLNKARRKVEAAVVEIQAKSGQPSQPLHPPAAHAGHQRQENGNHAPSTQVQQHSTSFTTPELQQPQQYYAPSQPQQPHQTTLPLRPLPPPQNPQLSSSLGENQSAATAGIIQSTALSCLSTEGVRTTSIQFYVPLTGEDFSACHNCYRKYIEPYPSLASNFAPYEGSENVFICDLSFGRVQQVVLQHCVPYGSIEAIRNFVKMMPTFSPCSGDVISSGGPMWMARDAVIPDIAVCETCFELYFRLTEFEQHFERKVFSETRQWSCDIAMPFFKRLLRSELEKSPSDFSTFAEEANARFNLPPCAGYGKAIELHPAWNGCLVMIPREKKSGRICLACYSDYLELTQLTDEWQVVELVGDDIGKVTCDLAGEYSRVAMGVAIKRGDTDLWRNVVSLDGNLSPCCGNMGVDEAEIAKETQEKGEIAQWYHSINSPQVWSCPRCYWLTIQLFGASHLYTPLRRPLVPGTVRQCSWIHSSSPDESSMDSADNFENSTAWRGRQLRTGLTYGYETGNWTQLQIATTSVGKEPPACGGNARGFTLSSGRKWYGRKRVDATNNDDATIVMCEECFVRTVKGRGAEALFNTDLTEVAYHDGGVDGFICQPYSNRARAYVRAAAESGDLPTFARYWNNREALAARRNKWMPIMQEQLQRQNHQFALHNEQTNAQIYQNGLQMVLKVNAMGNALSQKSSAHMVEAVTGETGYRWGNSTVRALPHYFGIPHRLIFTDWDRLYDQRKCRRGAGMV